MLLSPLCSHALAVEPLHMGDNGAMIWDSLYKPMVIVLYKHSHITNIDIIRWLSCFRGGGTLSLRVLKARDRYRV
jgi:hypothetical protein